MRALVTRLRSDKQREKVFVADWPDPGKPTGNKVRTRTLFSGVTNGTERNDLLRGNYSHRDDELPAGWGYQNVGEVVELGPNVKQLKVGDVLYMSQDHMEFCLEPEDGLHIVVPDEVDRRHAALFGMTSVAMRSCRHAELRMGDRLLVVGAGIIGQVAAQIATVMGARVTIGDVDEHRLDIARKIGAAEAAVNLGGSGWEQHVPESSFDTILDVAGVPGMVDKMILATKQRGKLLLIAGRDKVEYTFNFGQFHEITIRQNGHFDNDDLANVCRLVVRGMIQFGPLIQDVVPAAEAKRIYDTLRDAPQKLLGTVFDWS
jgi:2-desacetyl-2-hydroxyethyl bacteriochlorophyllide A dehydrogenase